MKQVFVEVNDDVLEQATNVLDDLGMDIQGAIRMFLKRIAREQSIAFVLANIETASIVKENTIHNIEKYETEKINRGEMTKRTALCLFRDRGNRIDHTVTYSSKNRTTYIYWANPDFSVLNADWTLILNDWINRKLFLFRIPAHAIQPNQLIPRNDKKNLIDIQIHESDPTFTDRRSDYSFKRFLVDETEY